MHELSIVTSIVDIANEEAEKAGIKQFSDIKLAIGTQSGIVLEALHFAWKHGVKNSVIENAKLKIEIIKAIAVCEDCKHEFEAESLYDYCPRCNSLFTNIIQGKEMRILALEFDQ
jgi:hydrogenase nickel incorporation protein HypA/HybF